MKNFLLTLLFAATALFAQTTEPAGAPPSGVDPAIAALLQKDGVRVKDGGKVVAELWFRNAAPAGSKNTERAAAPITSASQTRRQRSWSGR